MGSTEVSGLLLQYSGFVAINDACPALIRADNGRSGLALCRAAIEEQIKSKAEQTLCTGQKEYMIKMPERACMQQRW